MSKIPPNRLFLAFRIVPDFLRRLIRLIQMDYTIDQKRLVLFCEYCKQSKSIYRNREEITALCDKILYLITI